MIKTGENLIFLNTFHKDGNLNKIIVGHFDIKDPKNVKCVFNAIQPWHFIPMTA